MGKRTASAETLKADPRYNSKLASKFINCLMWQGKKPTAQRIFYGALDQIKKRMPDADPIEVFTQAVEHVKPTVEVRSKRVGGATYQVPMQVNRTRQQSLAIRWIIGASRAKAGRPKSAILYSLCDYGVCLAAIRLETGTSTSPRPETINCETGPSDLNRTARLVLRAVLCEMRISLESIRLSGVENAELSDLFPG